MKINRKSFLWLVFSAFLFFASPVSAQERLSEDTAAACQAAGGTCYPNDANCRTVPGGNTANYDLIGFCGIESTSCCKPKANAVQAGGAVACQNQGGTCRPGGTGCMSNETQNGSCPSSGGAPQVCCVKPTASTTAASAGLLNYTLLEKIPGTDNLQGSDLKAYLEALYRIALILVTLSAVFMISIGGFMYLTSAGNTHQAETAKGVIYDSLIGLVIALCAWLLLYVINPDLANPRVPILSNASYTPTTPGPRTPVSPPPRGSGSGCGGYSVSSNINSSQCNDASQQLSDILSCMHAKYPNTRITSISDSGGFNTCKNNWARGTCAHAQGSCHYGGGASNTGQECQKSHAADISVRTASGNLDLSMGDHIIAAAQACGARVKDERQTKAPHIHISTQTDCCRL